MAKKILSLSALCLLTVGAVWLTYSLTAYRMAHPQKTETQVFLHIIGQGE